MEKIERSVIENATFSKAIVSFYDLLKAIQDKTGALDEESMHAIGEILAEHIGQLQRAFYATSDLQDFFTFGSGLIDDMNQALRALLP